MEKKKNSAKQGRARHALLEEGQALLDKHSMTSRRPVLEEKEKTWCLLFLVVN